MNELEAEDRRTPTSCWTVATGQECMDFVDPMCKLHIEHTEKTRLHAGSMDEISLSARALE